MEQDDLNEAARAATFPVMSLIRALVGKGVLTEAEALQIVEVSGSIDPQGPATQAAIRAIEMMTPTLDANFKSEKRNR